MTAQNRLASGLKFYLIMMVVVFSAIAGVYLADQGDDSLPATLEHRRTINGIVAIILAAITLYQGRRDVGAFANLFTADNGWPVEWASENAREDI